MPERGSGGRFGVAEIPLDRDELALGVTHDAFSVATELRIIARKQDEASENTGAEFVEHLTITPVAVDLPVRCNRPVVHDARVGTGLLGDLFVTHANDAIGRSDAA